MSSNPDSRCYNVYFPSGIRASYPIQVSSSASLLRVRQLNKSFTLYKFCKKYEASPEEFYRGVVEWLHSDPAGREQMHLGSLLREYFPNGPASAEEEQIDVVIATDSIMENREKGLEIFLRTTTLPSRTIDETTSNRTHPYDTSRVLILEDDFPFVAIKFEIMASLMIDDLFARVLSDHPVKDRESLSRANALTYNILYTCVACVDAVGSKFVMETEKSNECANVQMDSIVRLEESANVRMDSVDNSTSIQNRPGLTVEDKSPKVFRTHCTDENIDALCQNEVWHLQDTEYGFRAIFFNACQLTIYMVQERLGSVGVY
ncbi:hypothetical protein ACEPAH_2648 [Sanghuangporus vaninii]